MTTCERRHGDRRAAASRPARSRTGRRDRAVRHGRRGAVLNRRGADPARAHADLLDHPARGPPRAVRGAELFLAAAGLRRRDGRLRGFLARSAHQPDRLQAAGAVPDRAAGLSLRERPPADTLLTVVITVRGDQCGRSASFSTGSCITTSSAAAARHARPLHDLLGAADAGRSAWPSRACCSATAIGRGRRWSCRRSSSRWR